MRLDYLVQWWMMDARSHRVIIVGAGFAGLAAAYDLACKGYGVTVLEKENEVGGLAAGFPLDGYRLEKFYHHWFVHDTEIMELVRELGVEDQVALRPARTGVYCRGRVYRFSTPLDLLRFKPLRFRDRIRLGLAVLRARRAKDWRPLDDLSADEWLQRMCGPAAYELVWAPLLRGKFGEHAPDISAAWIWSKLVLRGGSRGRGGREMLACFRGGLDAITARLVSEIRRRSGSVLTGHQVKALAVYNHRFRAAATDQGWFDGDAVILTPSLPIVAGLIEPHAPAQYAQDLRRVRYVANVCLVLQLDRKLSDIYWLNVNDPGFPFVGVIEHTNLEPPESYGGRHIVYLSRYVPEDSPFFIAGDEEVFKTALPRLQRIFPTLSEDWVRRYNVWRTPCGQALVARGYGKLVPEIATPVKGAYLATLAQVYPQDRGITYSVRDGRKAASMVDDFLRRSGNSIMIP